MNLEEKRSEEAQLLAVIARELPRLEELWQKYSSHWDYEDSIYRFYHQSFKVCRLQNSTREIVEILQSLAPHLPLNEWFMEIVSEGANCKFVNEQWTKTTRAMVEAFFHARYFLEMVCKYGRELKEPPQPMPSGWAAVTELYQIR
jgi:hypothetical protein